MDGVEELFDQLRAATAPQTPAKAPQTPAPAPAELDLDDPAERDTQAAFEQIDRKLRGLPRLRSGFDALAAAPAARRPAGEPARPQRDPHAWFLLPKPDRAAADRAQRDLLLIKHRAALDPKRHYKKDRWQPPERFAIGTLHDAGAPARAGSLLDTLAADRDSGRYFKRRYAQIQAASTAGRQAHRRRLKAQRRAKR